MGSSVIIDPRTHRRRNTPPDSRAPLIVIVGLAIEVAALCDLAEWEPCGVLLDEIPLAASGQGSLTVREVNRLRTWAHNWRTLTDELRAFYSRHHAEPGVAHGLWYVLGTTTRPTGPSVGLIRRTYADITGHEPGIDLLPRPATQECAT